MLLTIFLRLTWMNKEHVADVIQNYLATSDTSLSREQLIVLAKQIRKPMWDWHVYSGYVLVGLYCLRMALPFFGKMKFSNPLKKQLTNKMKFQYWLYLVFYGCVAISLITGLTIELGPKTLKPSMESVHELSIYYLIAFIMLHIGGIIIAELTNQQGIISRMISGTKNKKTTFR
jgi:cytochrome b561